MNRTSSENFWRGLGKMVCVSVLALLPFTLLRAQTNEMQKMPLPAPRRPSVILIVADNIGYGDLGCYGQTKIKTPNLDKLAAEGIRFTSFYAGSPDDAASRATLLTGMEPRHLHAGFNEVLPSNALTVAAFLKQLGYHTGLIGTWGLGDTGAATPDKKGFEQFAGFLNQNHARDYFTDRIWRHDPTPNQEGQIYDGYTIFPENESGKRGRFIPDLLSDVAVNFVRINKPDSFNQYRPFFLCLSYPIPHVSANAAPPSSSQYSDAPWPPLERIRATLISRMDDGIGKLMDKLAEMKINTNTVVVFTSVGGPQFEKGIAPEFFKSAGQLRGQQGSVYEGGIRVPMIIRWPAQIKPGETSDLTWSAWDVLPTLAEIALTKPPEKLDGISILPMLLGKKQKNHHESFYWESSDNGLQQAVRMEDWKGVRTNATAAIELYNLRTDAGEKENAAGKNPAELKKMEKALGPAK
jgi:arylsulfatase A-like enzyme